MNAIAVREVVVRRRSGFTLGPVSLDLGAGSTTALVGPSGCGKTTLLRCIAGLHALDAGTISIGGLTTDAPRRLIAPNARGIGFVFQDGGLWPHMTASAHLRFANPALDARAARQRLEQVGLGARADARPGTLSGGECQRLALARALAGDPRILLLDEPLHSVDAPLRRQLGSLIREMVEARKLTMLLVTHDRTEARALTDDLVVMEGGRILESSPFLAEFRSRPATSVGELPGTHGKDGREGAELGVAP